VIDIQKGVIYNFSDEEFSKIVEESYSVGEVTKKVGYKTWKTGGGRRKVQDRIRELKLSTNHFKPNGRQYEKVSHNKITDYRLVLKKNSYMTNNNTIRSIILRENLIPYECAYCKNTGYWNGKELQLQLHHEDGDHANNDLSNLVFLCPNCHTQTDNYGFKNTKRAKKKKYYCTNCGEEITKDTRTGLCRMCANKKLFTKEIPEKSKLISTIKDIKYKKYICFEYGISEHTFTKWLESYDLPTHISELHKYIIDNNL
jgi:5-methylcytosine-specific restriction endonuclease McrA